MALYKVHVKQTLPVIVETIDIEADSHEEAEKKAQDFIEAEKDYDKDIELQVDEVPTTLPELTEDTEDDTSDNSGEEVAQFDTVETEQEGIDRQARIEAERAEQERNNG